MKRINGRCSEDAHHLTQTLILGDLEMLNEAFLSFTGIPHLSPVGEHQDNEGIVDLPPVEEVEASDRVAEEGDPLDGRSGPVGHDGDVVGPVELVIYVDTEVSKGLDRGDVERFTSWEGVSCAVDGWADKFGVCTFGGEGHEFSFGGVGLEAIVVEPGEDGFIFGSRRFGGGFEGGRDGVDGAIVDIEGEVSMSPRFCCI